MRNKQLWTIWLGLAVMANTAIGETIKRKPTLLKRSGDEFVFYSVDGNTPGIKIYKVEGGKPKVTDSFSPDFPGDNTIVKKTSPDGRQYFTAKCNLIGTAGNEFYFLNIFTRKVSVYSREKATFEEKIVRYPRMLNRVYPVSGSLLFTATAVMFPRKRTPCEDKYFVIKDQSFKDVLCFGTGKDIIKEKDFPLTTVFDKGKRAAIYFTKSGEISVYATGKGDLIEKYIVDPSELLKIGERGKRERLFGNHHQAALLKMTKDKAALFLMEGKKWKMNRVVDGCFQTGVILDRCIVLIEQGGEIVVKEIRN